MNVLLAIAMSIELMGNAGAATQAPTSPPRPAPAPQRRVQPRATGPTTVTVRDVSGTAMRDVKVSLNGAATQRATTGPDGTATLGTLADGVYRLRFEREGFITLEREVTIRGRQDEVEVYLTAAPPQPLPPALTPPPAPEPPPPPAPSSVASAPSGPPMFVSIPEFLDKNYVGREPLKESVLGCLADSTTRILQLRDPIVEHAHQDLDEVLYVVAGEAMIRVRDQATPVAAGSLSIIPHGQPHAILPRGRNPLMLLSILSGAPCRATDQGARPKGSGGSQK